MGDQKKFKEELEAGPLKVELYNEGYGMELGIRRNGYQTTCCGVNDDLIEMLIALLLNHQEQNKCAKK